MSEMQKKCCIYFFSRVQNYTKGTVLFVYILHAIYLQKNVCHRHTYLIAHQYDKCDIRFQAHGLCRIIRYFYH